MTSALPTRPAAARACAPRAAAAFAACLLAACGTTPPERVHSLLGGEPVARAASAAPATPSARVFTLGPVRVPPGTEGPQWLVRLPDDTLARLEQDRWAADLRDELRAALADHLVRASATDARAAPGAGVGVRIDVDLRRFETAPGRGVWVAGTFALVPPVAAGAALPAAVVCPFERTEAQTGGTADLAAAHRRAVADLGAAIGRAIERGACI
jgi:uncharacterized lipoprotein YmbA